jgi:hypothetical protein
MLVATPLYLGASDLGNVAAGAIGTAAATVDRYSAFSVTQTVAAVCTLPAPTGAPAHQVVKVSNKAAATAAITLYGVAIAPGRHAEFVWDGATWNPETIPKSVAAFTQVVAFAANTGLIITHNLALANPQAYTLRATTATGLELTLVQSAQTANSLTLTSNVAISGVQIVVMG